MPHDDKDNDKLSNDLMSKEKNFIRRNSRCYNSFYCLRLRNLRFFSLLLKEIVRKTMKNSNDEIFEFGKK